MGRSSSKRHAGFSLVEVVVAVGIFAVSIIAVIGLLAPTNKNIAAVRDTDDTSRVVSAIQSKLQDKALETNGFTTVGGFLQTSAPADPADGNEYTNALTLYASRDGTRVGLANGTNPNGTAIFSNASQKYFEIVLIRNTALSSNSGTNLDANAGYLAFTMRIRWPAFTAEGVEFTQHSQKSVLLVPASVHR